MEMATEGPTEGPVLTCCLHPARPLELYSQPPYSTRDYVCDLCFRIGEGQTYHCKTCKYDMHPSCAALQPTVRNWAHAHPLTLAGPFRYREGGSGYEGGKKGKCCDGCKTSLRDCEWSYRCEVCDFDLHARCAKLRERILTPFHPYPLKLLPKSPYPPRRLKCDLCDEGMPTHGWVYHCTNCKFDLHPSCAVLPRDPLCLPAHQHRLSTFGYRTYRGKSYVCEVCLELGGELGYRCDACNFNIHPKCLKALFPTSPSGREVHVCLRPGPKFKLTSYGVRTLCDDDVTESTRRGAYTGRGAGLLLN